MASPIAFLQWFQTFRIFVQYGIAAKNPAEMRAGNFLTFTFRLEGPDTLWLTTKTDENGPLANPTTVKLTRLE